MPELKLRYRHNHRHEPHFNNNADIEQLAAAVRGQLGVATRRAISIGDLSAVDKLNVNGVGYELWKDVEHEVHDEFGNDVLGVFEYTPQSCLDAVSISVSPADAGISQQLILSTFAHEMGHAIYDGPALVAYHQNQPLIDVRHADSVRAYRLVTESPAHLQKQDAQLPSHIRFAELRANEFMGSLLVPRDLLWDAITEEASKHALSIRYEDTLFAESMDGNKQLVWTEATFDVDCWSFTRVLAPHFGVTPAFIQVRMKRYGIIPSQSKTH